METDGLLITDQAAYEAQVTLHQNTITDEIFFALGMGRGGLPRRILGPFFRTPARRFGRVAANFENVTTRAAFCFKP